MADDTGDDVLRRSALADDIEFLAIKVFADGTRLANTLLDEHGLRVRSYSVLALAVAETDVTQRDLAAALSLDPSQIVALVDELENAGFVRREVDPADRRSRRIQATDAGRARFDLARASVRDAESESLADLSASERETLRALLRKLVFGA